MGNVLRVFLVGVLCLSGVLLATYGAVAADFPDVPKWDWSWCYVQGLSDAGVTGGYGDGLFHPDWTVTRDQMAVFLVRALGEEPDNPKDPQSWKDAYGYDPAEPTTWAVDFSDVPSTGWGDEGGPYWAWFHIQRLYAIGVTKGVTATEYGPSQEVRRDQMAVFLIRALGLECADPCEDASCWAYDPSNPGTWAHEFEDVPATGQATCHGAHWAWFHIQALYETEVTTGVTLTTYGPEQMVRRDQMAAFICRAWDLPMPPKPYNVSEYFPLGQGDTRTYQSDEGLYTTTVSGTAALWGQTYACLAISPGGAVDYWQAAPDGLHMGGGYEPGGPTTTSWNPPLCLPNGLSPGDEGTQTTATYRDSASVGQTTFTYRFIGVEGVTVPAGALADCLKFEILIDKPDTHDQHFYVWLAKALGIVVRDDRPFGGTGWTELVSGAIGDVNPPAVSFDLTDYYPLDQGDTWTYASLLGDFTQTISGTIMLSGQQYVCRLESGGPTRYERAAADGIHWVGSSEGADRVICDPPLVLPNDVYESVQTTSVYVNDVYQGQGTFICRVVSVGDVFVPAGTFPSCVKLELEVDLPGGISDHVYQWMAKDVGVVSQSDTAFGGAYWEYLTSAYVGGVDYP